MKFSEQWLRTLVNPQVGRDELVARLSMAGLEVDAVEPVAGEFSGVVVGEVLECGQHPNADKLSLCVVSDGEQQVNVVCGAPNARAGLKVAFAKVGAVLPGDFKIKKAKLRGVESFGMLCSDAELKISEDHNGIIELPADAPVGQCLREYLDLDDVSIEVDLTPNRGDCLSLTGLAREVGALYSTEVSYPQIKEISASHEQVLPVELLAPSACPRYVGRVIRNIDLTRPTPDWMKTRLERSGVRSIDPAVDVTNYVMLELGQPMHAFDLAQIRGGIRVRMAQAGEPLTLLDGQEVKLNSDTLVIADHERALAIAGVMGGEDSGVDTASTKDLFLESAFFAPIAVAGKARSYGLHTDASHRFERGVDYDLAARAMQRATELLLEIVGGEAGPLIDARDDSAMPQTQQVKLRAERVNSMFGLELTDNEIESLLLPLGLELKAEGAGQWQVDVPSHRFDISIEEDLIEEAGRLYNYDRLPVRYPAARLAPQKKPEARAELPLLRRLLVARGYQEVVTYSFIDEDSYVLFSQQPPLKLANPISADLSCMRSSLLPGLLKALEHNLNRQQTRVRLFESGLRFVGQLDNLKQEPMLAGVITGLRLPEGWANGKDKVDFYDLKADVEAVLAAAGSLDAFSFKPAQKDGFHPGQCAAIERDGEVIGHLGTLHPQTAAAMDIDQQVFMFELELEAATAGRLPQFSELSKFPEVRRDFALVVKTDTPAADIVGCMRKQAGECLNEVRLFDVYQGQGVEPGCKSMALGLTWQHPSRTLTDEEVNSAVEQMLQSLNDEFGATLRK